MKPFLILRWMERWCRCEPGKKTIEMVGDVHLPKFSFGRLLYTIVQVSLAPSRPSSSTRIHQVPQAVKVTRTPNAEGRRPSAGWKHAFRAR